MASVYQKTNRYTVYILYIHYIYNILIYVYIFILRSYDDSPFTGFGVTGHEEVITRSKQFEQNNSSQTLPRKKTAKGKVTTTNHAWLLA
jgi:hypothetical protein